MNPFNLNEALAGKKVVCRDEKIVVKRIVHIPELAPQSVLVVYGEYPRYGCGYFRCTETGSATISDAYDLFMASEKKVGWVNLYISSSSVYPGAVIFTNLEEAVRIGKGSNGESKLYISSHRLEWEE